MPSRRCAITLVLCRKSPILLCHLPSEAEDHIGTGTTRSTPRRRIHMTLKSFRLTPRSDLVTGGLSPLTSSEDELVGISSTMEHLRTTACVPLFLPLRHVKAYIYSALLAQSSPTPLLGPQFHTRCALQPGQQVWCWPQEYVVSSSARVSKYPALTARAVIRQRATAFSAPRPSGRSRP